MCTKTTYHSLRVELVQEGQGGVLAAAEGAELVVAIPGHGEKRVPTVHKVNLQMQGQSDTKNRETDQLLRWYLVNGISVSLCPQHVGSL